MRFMRLPLPLSPVSSSAGPKPKSQTTTLSDPTDGPVKETPLIQPTGRSPSEIQFLILLYYNVSLFGRPSCGLIKVDDGLLLFCKIVNYGLRLTILCVIFSFTEVQFGLD